MRQTDITCLLIWCTENTASLLGYSSANNTYIIRKYQTTQTEGSSQFNCPVFLKIDTKENSEEVSWIKGDKNSWIWNNPTDWFQILKDIILVISKIQKASVAQVVIVSQCYFPDCDSHTPIIEESIDVFWGKAEVLKDNGVLCLQPIFSWFRDINWIWVIKGV